MRKSIFMAAVGAAALIILSTPSKAHDSMGAAVSKSTADDHAPIGVMGDHMHKAGEWMLGYRYMHMDMNDVRDGTNDLSPEEIVTSVANRFAGMAGQPATLRVVPLEMQMDMHMFGVMYAPTDWVTLVAMGNYIKKEMTAVTFAGMAGTTRLGENTMSSEGWGDVKVNSLWRLYDDGQHHVHLNMGLSLPTGSIEETGTMLMPNGMRMNRRLGYGMQLGTGTYDLMPGVTYTAHSGAWGWGAQAKGKIALEDENDEGYSWGDAYMATAWGSYEWAPWISTSLRVSGVTQDSIDGIDANIVGPNQAADPDNFGGERLEWGAGVNLMAQSGPLKDHRLAFELSAPFYQDLNGPQMKRDYSFVVGWQYAF
ncbi:MAG: alpha-amylase [Micavibrio sp.]|nr:alpha-amylase [Micavibrio sp.]|tara:strand:+ start:353 stop:1453 length:1101 start_codon:yes stop_codon:yes gene_type:complete